MVSTRNAEARANDPRGFGILNHSGNSTEAELIQVTLKAQSNPDVEVVVHAPAGDTCREAMVVSGLMPRDGSPCHCLNLNGRIIDNRCVSKYPVFQIGVPPTLEPVWIEETNRRGTVGIGFLQDGTKAFVPGVEAAEFVWIYRCREWKTNGESRCNATRVRVGVGDPFEVGDLIYITPEYGENNHQIYNSRSGVLNNRMKVEIPPKTHRNRYEGVDWVVRITSISPLVGLLCPESTYIPPHRNCQG